MIGGALVPHEIFEALDLPFITDVWYSGLVAARRQSPTTPIFSPARAFTVASAATGRSTLAVLMDEDNPDKPWGGLPKPALVVNGLGDRGADVLAEFSGAVRVPLEMPVLDRPIPNWWEMSRWQWEDLDRSYRIDAMLEQFKDLVAAAEKIAGKRLDIDRLREIVDRVNEQEATSTRSVPSSLPPRNCRRVWARSCRRRWASSGTAGRNGRSNRRARSATR